MLHISGFNEEEMHYLLGIINLGLMAKNLNFVAEKKYKEGKEYDLVVVPKPPRALELADKWFPKLIVWCAGLGFLIHFIHSHLK